MTDPATIALSAIAALERRDLDALTALYHPEIAFHWPPGLPYSGHHRGGGVADMSRIFERVWAPLQPDAETRRMDPMVVAADEDTAVIRYRWAARSSKGLRFETDVLGVYRVADGLLRDVRMVYDDLPGMLEFLGVRADLVSPD